MNRFIITLILSIVLSLTAKRPDLTERTHLILDNWNGGIITSKVIVINGAVKSLDNITATLVTSALTLATQWYEIPMIRNPCKTFW